MQTFKQYFQTLLNERAEMISNISKFEKLINQIEDKVKNHPKFEHGARIEVQMGKTILPIFFYHSFPTRLKKLARIEKNDIFMAKFIPRFEGYKEYSGSIVISLDNLYRGQEIKNPFMYTQQHFPFDLKNLLLHELQHAWEDLIKKISDHTFPEKETELDPAKKYYNNPSELNAHLIQFIHHQAHTNTILHKFIKNYDVQSAIDLVINKLRKEEFVQYAHPNNRRWILKTAYTLFDQYLNKIVDRLKKQGK